MQKKNFLYILYCSIVVVGIMLFLVFYRNVQFKEDGDNTSNSTVTYASSFSLLCPKEITICEGGTAFLKNYISIKPAQMETEITTTLTNYAGGVATGIEFKDNCITAKMPGFYRISFKVLEDENSYLTQVIVVHVVAKDEFETVKQTSNTLTEGDNKQLTDLFSLNLGSTITKISSLNNSILSYESSFTAIGSGNATIKMDIEFEYITYSYLYNFIVKPKPEYKINIVNFGENIETSKTKLTIQFEVIDGNNEYVSQLITATSSDISVATVESCDAPFIILKRVTSGTIILTITSAEDLSVVKTISITFE